MIALALSSPSFVAPLNLHASAQLAIRMGEGSSRICSSEATRGKRRALRSNMCHAPPMLTHTILMQSNGTIMHAAPAADPEPMVRVDPNAYRRRKILPSPWGDRTRDLYGSYAYFDVERSLDGISKQHRRSTSNAVAVEEAAIRHNLIVERWSGSDFDSKACEAALDEMVVLTERNMLRTLRFFAWVT